MLCVGGLTIGPVVTGWALPPPYPREVARNCPGFTGGSMTSGGTGPVTVVHAFPDTLTNPPASVAAGDISYAEFGSESLGAAGESVSGIPTSSASATWLYIRGRWPIKMTKKLVAAAYGTTAIIETQMVGTYERHRVYVRKDSSSTKVVVRLRRNELPATGSPPLFEITVTFAAGDAVGSWKYVETVMSGSPAIEQLAVNPVVAPGAGESGTTEWQFVNAVHTFADVTKGFGGVTFP